MKTLRNRSPIIRAMNGADGRDGADIARFLKEEALRLGFTAAGITSPDPPPHLDVYRAWIDAGRHGEMGYLATRDAVRRRGSPDVLLPGCRSILVLAAPHDPPPVHPLSPQIASYAVGQDYHEVLLIKMRSLVRSLEEKLGSAVRHRLYTDTGPILEREMAQRAGLGWIGKNTCLIDPQAGSYILLAEILLDLPLPRDEPFLEDRCGTCTRCVEACPTDCILPDRTIDAARCISYLTIEVKGSIDPDLRGATGGWLFGCDVCQQVCPWNLRFAPASGEPEFARRPFLDPPDLARFLLLDEVVVKSELSHSPLKRAKRRGLVRNAALAAGNSGDRSHLGALAALTHDGDPVVRGHAAWALGKIGGAAAKAALEAHLAIEQDTEVSREIEAALQSVAPYHAT